MLSTIFAHYQSPSVNVKVKNRGARCLIRKSYEEGCIRRVSDLKILKFQSNRKQQKLSIAVVRRQSVALCTKICVVDVIADIGKLTVMR